MVNRFVLARLPRATLGALVTMAVLTLGAQNTYAQRPIGTAEPVTGTSAPNWTPNGVPNSPSTDVSITGTSSSVTLDNTLDNLSPTIQNLSLDSFSTLTMVGVSLHVAGSTISNNERS